MLAVFSTNAIAACDPNALGTARTITLDPSKHRVINGKEAKLGLRPKEVILTFDDGPIAGKTPRILQALKKECVKATFFYVGRMARAYPRIVRRVVNDGHTLAHHTHGHNRLPNYSNVKIGRLIDKGVSQVQKIAFGDASSTPRTPFFRYPYLARTKRTDRVLARKGLIAFGANIDSLDWKLKSPGAVHNRIMRRLRQEGRGIVLMHDIQSRTAKMLPRLLRSLKKEGFKIVHIVPKGTLAPKVEPQLIASLDTSPKPNTKLVTKVGLNSFPSPATEVDPDNRGVEYRGWVGDEYEQIMASFENQADHEVARLKKRSQTSSIELPDLDNVSRTGVSAGPIVAVEGVHNPVNQYEIAALLPPKAAKQAASQLGSGRKPEQPQKSIAVAKKPIKTKPNRPSTKVARRTKSIVVKTGAWKLRRSQWILR